MGKQEAVFLNKKGGLSKAKQRYTRNPGLGFKAPRDVNASFVDKKCPFTGNCSIRGRILTGTITKKNMAVHLSPCFRDVKVGDVATVGECRPLSKTVKFNTLKITKGAGNKKAFAKF